MAAHLKNINTIVTRLGNRRFVERLITPFVSDIGESNRDDLAQEVYIKILTTKNPEKLIRAYNRGEIGILLLEYIKRMIYQEREPFFKNITRYNNRKVDLTVLHTGEGCIPDNYDEDFE